MLLCYAVQDYRFTYRWQAVEACKVLGLPITTIKRKRVKINASVEEDRRLDAERERRQERLDEAASDWDF